MSRGFGLNGQCHHSFGWAKNLAIPRIFTIAATNERSRDGSKDPQSLFPQLRRVDLGFVGEDSAGIPPAEDDHLRSRPDC